MKNRSFPCDLILGALLAFVAMEVRALEPPCVSSATELADALKLVENNGSSDEIRIERGKIVNASPMSAVYTYAFSAIDGKGLKISGGWNPGCTVQSQDAHETVLTRSQGRILLKLGGLGYNDLAEAPLFHLSNLTLSGEGLPSGGAPCGGLKTQGRLWLGLDRVVVSDFQCQATDIETYGGPVVVRGSLFAHNRAAVWPAFYVAKNFVGNQQTVIAPSEVIFSGNTVAFNHATGDLRMVVIPAEAGSTYIENNAFWGNVSSSPQNPIEVSADPDALVRNNLVQHAGGLFSTEDNLVGSGPRFLDASDFPHGLRPGIGSPMRNSAHPSPIGGHASVDLRGFGRPHEGALDIGAYEFEMPPNQPPSALAPTELTVAADTPLGLPIYTVEASDDSIPSPLSYSIVPSDCSSLFDIDAEGTVGLAAPVPSAMSECSLSVEVDDGEYSLAVDTLVRFNRAPTLSGGSMDLPASAGLGTVVWTFSAEDDGLPLDPGALDLARHPGERRDPVALVFTTNAGATALDDQLHC